MRRWAGGIDNNVAALKGDDKVRQGIDEMAAGLPPWQRLPMREAGRSGRKILSTARNATREDAKHAAQGVLDAAAAWLKTVAAEAGRCGGSVEGRDGVADDNIMPGIGMLRKGRCPSRCSGACGGCGEHGGEAGQKTAAKQARRQTTDDVAGRGTVHVARPDIAGTPSGFWAEG